MFKTCLLVDPLECNHGYILVVTYISIFLFIYINYDMIICNGLRSGAASLSPDPSCLDHPLSPLLVSSLLEGPLGKA